MKLLDAVSAKLLRVVPLQDNGYPEPYKDVPQVDVQTLLDTDVALINTEKSFLLVKDADLAKHSVASHTNMTLVDITNAQIDFVTIKKPTKSQFIRVKLTKALLDQEIIPWSVASRAIHNLTFDELMTRFIAGSTLTDVELLSLSLDARTREVVDVSELVGMVKHAFILEIVTLKTPRARLFSQVFQAGHTTPYALRLFNEKERAILKKAEVLE